MSKVVDMIGHGVYSVAEAARLAGVSAGQLGRWFKGRADQPESKPLLVSDYPTVAGRLAISFRDMIDAFVASQLFRHGVKLPTLRMSYRNLQERYGEKHGFCHEELKDGLKTDGSTVFLDSLDAGNRRALVDLFNKQRAIPEVLEPFLKKLDFDPISKLAARWRIADGVLVDPMLNFGKPVAVNAGVSTHVLYRAFLANGQSAEVVSGWYDVDLAAVRAAVKFEQGLAA